MVELQAIIADRGNSREGLGVDALSDVGGVAARLGFKYQDHVAAMFVLQMIDDRRILQVECETSDDITLLHRRGTETCAEYVQVKSTDRDNKWTFKEITDRDSSGKDRPTSLAEKSLLADKAGANPRFRIVARRSVNATAAALLEPVDRRNPAGAIEALATKILAKHRATRSEMGNDLGYWTRNACWEVLPGVDHVELKNLHAISTMAEDAGANPTNSHVKAIYRDLLAMVDAAAVATRKQPELKTISRAEAVAWWEKHLAETNAAQTKTSKPYRTKGDRFFAEIHRVDAEFHRSSSGYDARYERKVWRSKQLARHLADWVPELTLKASELVEITPLNMRAKFEAALQVVKAERALDVGNLLAETLLHAVLRHWFGSEPVPCKLFHRSTHGDKVTKNAHLVHGEKGDELWIGRTHLFDERDPAPLYARIGAELTDALDTELLVEERGIILQLREPQHYTDHAIGAALSPGAPIDDFIRVLCLPLLIAYDSSVLSDGHADDYQARLVEEIAQLGAGVTASLPASVEEVRVHVFLIPVENLAVLKDQFAEHLGLS